jgi:PAS domain S-box-containing protein
MGRRVRDRERALTDANRRLRAEVAERRRAETVNRALLDIANAVVTAHDLDELYGAIHRTLGRVLDVTNFFIALYDPERRAIVFPYWRDEVDAEFPEVTDFTETGSLTGEVIMARRPLMMRREELRERARDGRMRGTTPEIWLGAPLMVGSRVVGVMAAQSYTDPDRYSEADLEVLSSVSGQVAMVIERKRSEAALRESEARFKTLFDVSPQVISVSELETGRFVDVNAEFCRLSGYEKNQVVGRTTVELGLFSQTSRASVVEALEAGGGEILGVEQIFRKSTGEMAETLLSARKIRIDDREMILAVVNDITPLRKALREREELQERLARSRKMEALGLLAGGVAHDLNNILSGVVSYPELLLMDMAPDNPMRQPIETIKRSGEKAAAIVQDLLTLARRGVAITEKVDLNVLIRRYLGSPEYQVLMGRHPQVAVETRLAADLMPIEGSPVHLSKTIMNLVANAAEAMPGGGRIDIETANCHIDQPVCGYDDVCQGAYVTFRIADSGVGIAPADQRRIFEPFYTKKVMGKSGSGLGMAVVWGTVKDHNGYIDVQSTEGRGTVFTLYLPVAQQGPAAPEPHPATEELLGRGEHVLVVDDMPEQRQIAAAMLEKLGYEVHTVASGEEAVAYLVLHQTDLVVLDMIMDPGIDGLETYRQILKLHPHQKAIIVSGFSENERVKAAQALGAGAYIRKPYTFEKIGLAVRTELDRPAAAAGPSPKGDPAT